MSDTFITTCPECAGEMQATLEHVGIEVACPFCQEPFVVGSPNEDDYYDESYAEESTFTESSNDPLNETAVYRADETMVMSYADAHDMHPYSAIPEVHAPPRPATPPPPPASMEPLVVFLHALEYQWPDYAASLVKLDIDAAWQYALVGEILDLSIGRLVKTVSKAEVNTTTNWLFNQKKSLAHLERFYGRYLDVVGQAQALLVPNLPDPPWEQQSDFYQEFFDELWRIGDEMGQLHLDICAEPLPEKPPFDELQLLTQNWAVDYARNLHILATRFHEKSTLPYEKTGIGVIQFTLTSPSFSRFLAIYQKML